MKCVLCHNDTFRSEKVQEETRRGDDIVLFTVEARVCTGCGERYYSREAMQHIEKMRKEVQEDSIYCEPVGRVFVCRETP